MAPKYNKCARNRNFNFCQAAKKAYADGKIQVPTPKEQYRIVFEYVNLQARYSNVLRLTKFKKYQTQIHLACDKLKKDLVKGLVPYAEQMANPSASTSSMATKGQPEVSLEEEEFVVEETSEEFVVEDTEEETAVPPVSVPSSSSAQPPTPV